MKSNISQKRESSKILGFILDMADFKVKNPTSIQAGWNIGKRLRRNKENKK